MRLTWKDGLGTLVAAAAIAVALAVTQSWGWPLLGSYRAGTLVLLVVGMVGCSVGSAPEAFTSRRDAVQTLEIALGALAAILIVVGLVAGTQGPFVALAAVIVLLWVVSTLRHAVAPARPRPA